MINNYKVITLEEKIEHIYVFVGKRDINYNELYKKNKEDKLFLNIFTEKELKEYSNKNVEFVDGYIYDDDSVEIIKKKIVMYCNLNIAYEELYLFYKTKTTIDSNKLYDNLTQKGNVKLTKTILNDYLSNFENILQNELNKEIYTRENIIELDLEKKEYIQNVPLGQEIKYENLYTVNPYESNYDYEKRSSEILINTQHKKLLLTSSNVENNTIYLCLAEKLLEHVSKDGENAELITIKTYYPNLVQYSKNKNEFELVRRKLIENTEESINDAFVKLTENIDLFYKIHMIESDEVKYKYDETGITEIDLIKISKTDIELPLEILFKLINSELTRPLIKYNPGKKTENIYRLYTNGLSTTGKKIPLLEKNEILKISKTLGLSKSVSIYSKINEVINIIEIEKNATLRVRIIYDKPKLIEEIEEDIKSALNPVIDIVNRYTSKMNYKIGHFISLKNDNIILTDIAYIWSLPIKKQLQLETKIACLSSVFNLIENVDKVDASLRFKRISNFNKMDSQDSLIRELKIKEYPDENVLNSLVNNFELTRDEAIQKLSEFYSAQQVEQNAFNRKKIRIRNNPGFLTKITKDKYSNMLEIKMNGIDSIKYLETINIYIDAIMKITQDDNIGKNPEVEKLCSGLEVISEERDEIIVDVDELESESEDEEDILNKMKSMAYKESEEEESEEEESEEEESEEEESEEESLKDVQGVEETKGNEGGGYGSDDDVVTNITGKSLTNPNPFFERLQKRVPSLFLTDSDGDYKAYSRICPSNLSRQPVILTDEEKEKIDKEHAGSYADKSIQVENDGKKYHYVCPRYWSLTKNVSLTEEQVKSGKYGKVIPQGSKVVPEGGEIIEFKSKHHTDSNGNYLQHYPGFLDRPKHPDKKCIPCCFKGWDSTQQVKRRKDCLEEEKTEEITEFNDTYIQGPDKFPLNANRIGHLPLSVQDLLNVDSNKCQESSRLTLNKPCMLRYGIEQNKEQSFLQCITDIYGKYKNKQMNITELKENLIENLDIDHFATLQNGSLVEVFGNINNENVDISEELEKSTIYKNELNTKFIQKLANAYNGFKEFIMDSTVRIDHKYLWDLVCMPFNGLFKEGRNLIIFEIDNHDITDNVRILCPTNLYSTNIFDINKETIMLIKKNNNYEPIYLINYNSDNNLIIMNSFNIKNMKKMPNIVEAFKFIKMALGNCQPKPSILSEDIPEKMLIYEFTKSLTLINIISKIENIDFYEVIAQIMNYDSKIVGILVENKVGTCYVPCFPSAPIIGNKVKTMFIDDYIPNNYSYTKNFLETLNTLSKNTIPCAPVIKILDNENLLVGILTQTNQFVQTEPEVDTYGDDLKVMRDYNYVLIDKEILLNNNVDNERIIQVKKIRKESAIYNSFRNVIRIELGKNSNYKTKEEVIEIIENKGMLYLLKLRLIIEILTKLVENDVCFTEIDEKIILENNELIISDENCSLIIPKKNLITNKDNKMLYFTQIADELIRYTNYKSFILHSKSLVNFGNVRYNLHENEIILVESLILDNYLEKLIPMVLNKYAKYGAYDDTLPYKTEDYNVEISENKVEIPEVKEEEENIELNTEDIQCKGPIKNKIASNSIWKNDFPDDSTILKYDSENNMCTFHLMIDLLRDKNIRKNINELKTDLIEEYLKLTEIDNKILMNELRSQGKADMVNSIVKKNVSLETIIINDNYYATNLDIWLLATKYNIPVVFYMSMLKDKNSFLVTCKDGSDSYYFVKSKNTRVKDDKPIFRLIVSKPNKKNIHIHELKVNVKNELEKELTIQEYFKLSREQRYIIVKRK